LKLLHYQNASIINKFREHQGILFWSSLQHLNYESMVLVFSNSTRGLISLQNHVSIWIFLISSSYQLSSIWSIFSCPWIFSLEGIKLVDSTPRRLRNFVLIYLIRTKKRAIKNRNLNIMGLWSQCVCWVFEWIGRSKNLLFYIS